MDSDISFNTPLCMRTTMDINDELLRAIKAHAADRRKTLEATVEMEHGCEWITLDRGFAAYPGLRLVDLLDSGTP